MHSWVLFSTLGYNPMLHLKKQFYLLIFGCWILVAMWAFLWLQRAGALSAAVPRLLAAAPLALEYRPQGTWASAVATPRLPSTDSTVVAHRLGCSLACGIFPNWGWNPCPCTGRWILYNWATREAPVQLLSYLAQCLPALATENHFGNKFWSLGLLVAMVISFRLLQLTE